MTNIRSYISKNHTIDVNDFLWKEVAASVWQSAKETRWEEFIKKKKKKKKKKLCTCFFFCILYVIFKPQFSELND